VSEPRLIRKYANRRLYDSTDSRHVTLDDIRRLVAQGIRVRVVDDKSGEDLTRQVLLQIIADQEQFGQPVLSIPLLEGIIRFYGNPVQEMLSRYLEQGLGTVLRQQQAVQAEMTRALETPLAPLAELARQNMDMWSRIQASMIAALNPSATTEPAAGGTGTAGAPSSAAPPSPAPDTEAEKTDKGGAA